MAIYSAVPPPPGYGGPANNTSQNQEEPAQASPTLFSLASGQMDVNAWAVTALQALSIAPETKGTMSPLAIPLDGEASARPCSSVRIEEARRRGDATTPPPRPPSRRDSQRRRDLLLKGKEGSRQRRRWENDRLMHVPNAQPPEPCDWEPRPVYPVHHVPYRVADVWDARLRAEVEKKRMAAARQKQEQTRTLGDKRVPGRVPRDLFERAKKTPAVRSWVRALEEPLRQFLVDCDVAQDDTETDGDEDEVEVDSEDDELVFVGRRTATRHGWKRAKREGHDDEPGMVFDSSGHDDDGTFKYGPRLHPCEGGSSGLTVNHYADLAPPRRWLTHSISMYYGLNSHSVMLGNPSRKVVYVDIKAVQMRTGQGTAAVRMQKPDLPRPLWQLC